MSIRYKLGFAFAAVLLLAGGLALYGMQTISRTGDAVIRLYDEPLVAVNRARAADANFDKARVTMGRAMAFLDRVPEDELHRLDALVRDVLEDLKIVRDRVNDQRVVDALDTAQFLIRDWHETGLKILRPAPGGLTEVPLAVTVARKADRAAAALDDVVELGAARGFEFRSMSDAAVAASRLSMMVLAMATAVVGVALSLAFAHSISRPIRAATAIAERVARGNFSDAIVSKRRDELGRLLWSLAQMQASLRAKAEAERLASQAKDRAHTEQVTKTEGELRRTRTFLDTVVENIPAMLFVKDARDHRFVLLNRAGEELLGVSREAVIGKNDYDFFPKEEADYFVSRDREVLQSGRLQIIEQEPIHTPHNGLRLLRTKKIAISDDNGDPQYLLGVSEDITDRKRAEAQIEHMARHDALTDLPNRTSFTDRLAFTLDRAATMGDRFAVLCVDLDRFKEVNDVFGHCVGDAALRETSRRLQTAAEGAFLARIGGDEFALIAAEGPQPAAAAALANRLFAAAADDMEIDGRQLRVGLSVGVAIFPVDGTDATTLIGNADAALYRAKAEGRGTIRFFERDMDVRLRERRALQQDLRSALDRDDLTVHYQPQAQTEGEIVGFEALIRWRHPERGWVSPDAFIPLAEESGLIIPIGERMLREACREAASWPAPLRVAVNLSTVEFRHGDLPRLVHSVLLETGLAADRLELEVTESVLIGDFSRAQSILRRLKSLGVRIAMDDFGTGYSSLSYLQSFPFDKIKIDKVFITNLERNPQSKAIVRGVIGLAKGLNLPVLAEGVETKAQLAFLRGEGCDEVQGYLVGRPQPIEQYADLICRPAKAKPSRAIAS